ncbi:MAG: DUF3524 domain-containing protein [Acidimicrobiia bacterium]|nr:DUF3524 domain-containing protein [Acidimicrobiia bacterium]
MTVAGEGPPLGGCGPLRVLLCEPYFTGSHRAWAEGLARHSRHRVHLVSHAGGFWKWRMQGAALTLAAQIDEVVAEHGRPHLLLVSDMVHVPALVGFARRALHEVPVVPYMHENQLTYPVPPGATPDHTYAMTNWLSMVAADRVVFNSAFHQGQLLPSYPSCCAASPITAISGGSTPSGPSRLSYRSASRPSMAAAGAPTPTAHPSSSGTTGGTTTRGRASSSGRSNRLPPRASTSGSPSLARASRRSPPTSPEPEPHWAPGSSTSVLPPEMSTAGCSLLPTSSSARRCTSSSAWRWWKPSLRVRCPCSPLDWPTPSSSPRVPRTCTTDLRTSSGSSAGRSPTVMSGELGRPEPTPT